MSREIIDSVYNRNPILQEGVFNKRNIGSGLATIIEFPGEVNGKINFNSEPSNGRRVTVEFGYIE